jgi:acyl-[acyl-carrier-protein] desaturase
MAQKPVASPFILELEPVVDENYDRHVATATPWYAHDYVPFEKGDNFTRLGGPTGIRRRSRCPATSPTRSRSC